MPRGAPLGESISASLVAIAAVVILSRRPEPWQQVGLIDLLAGWTVIGWVVALVLAFSLPRPGSPPPGLSFDGNGDIHSWDGLQQRQPGLRGNVTIARTVSRASRPFLMSAT